MSKMSSLQIKQVGPGFVGEVSGLDISKPLTPVDVAAISAGMDAQAVLVFRGQNLTNDQQLAFTNALGHLEDVVATSLRAADDNRLPAVFADVSNLDKDNKTFALDDRRRLFAIGNRLWHSDSSFKVIPARYSLLYSHSVTSRGGNTEFANMRMAYDAFDQETKDLVEDLVCEHSQIFSRQKLGFTDFSPEERERFKPVLQRLVRTHPSTGKKSIYLSSHAGTILDWPTPEARALLLDLIEHATQREFTYAHQWQVGDLVMWDNQQTMHRSRPYPHNEARDMRRTTLAGAAPTVDQQSA
ncbi:MAG: alpha-ketoglutarate-dependent 2,4-dichlorophenoxyacetate dioxygenase [Alphaproteobacteria bacterium]